MPSGGSYDSIAGDTSSNGSKNGSNPNVSSAAFANREKYNGTPAFTSANLTMAGILCVQRRYGNSN